MAPRTIRGRFNSSPAAEREFFRQLKKVAQASAHIVERYSDGARLHNERGLQQELREYAKKLGPWAERQAQKMLRSVSVANRRAYAEKSKVIGVALKEGMADTEVGMTAASLLFEQVDLIKSIPLEAGLRAQKIYYERVLAGQRAIPDEDTMRELEEQMDFTGDYLVSRAMLIARTETARATAHINQARAQAVGSSQYRWHNSGDGAVRKSHRVYKGRALQGRIFSWDSPPTLDDGMTGHPGTFPNCRCFAEPVFDGE